MRCLSKLGKPFALGLLFLATQLSATEIWNAPAFSADPAALRQEAATVPAEKGRAATVLLNDLNFIFDEAGGLAQTRHYIYRIENQEGVANWAETSGQWSPWHQAKPEIRARVITADGSVHWLDPKTLNDLAVHESSQETYSDERKFGGPLPAVAPGAIVEEEVVIRDKTPLFSAGTVHRWMLGWNVPVNKTRVVLSHPASLSLHFEVHLLPNATVTKSTDKGEETVLLEQGSLPAYTEQVDHAPSDVVLYPEIEFSTGTSWQAISSEYARLTEGKVRQADVQPLVTKVDTRNGNRNDVIRRLVSALHKNVRYTGVEFGESSLIPQLPAETLKRKYGDCKDKATVLVTMLRGAGIPANLALLDAGPGRDINKDLPGMGMFDHAIVYVPPSGPDPELWIDATAEYSQVGTLPWMDYGRWALVVSDKTQSLQQIPQITAEQNVRRELREFTLAEYGKAKIVEIDEEIGPEEAEYRDYYNKDGKELKESSESYVKEMYLADSLTSLEHGDLSDLETPASIKFVTIGKRGNTQLDSALAAIRVESLFDRLPKFFRTKEDQKAETEEEDKPKPRTADWEITPFTTEWRYKVTAPLGFKLRALPSDKNEKVDRLSFTQKYSSNTDNTVVEAIFRVENKSSRLTVQQANDLRDAVVKARDADPIFITFDSVGNSLMSAGKVKEGLAAYQQIASQHPKEALHKVQLAQALLTAGLAEKARSVALEATKLEPNSALAFSTLAMMLKHDLIGRLLKTGMDYDGAVAAYKKAIALDPKDKETLANLGLLLEHDADGTRYSERAPLKEAAKQMRELKKLDEDYSLKYDDNILFDLWYAHDYRGVQDYASTLPTSDARKGLILAATAIQQGVDSAIKKSMELTTENQERGKALLTAGTVLVRVRKYPEGAALLAEAARGQANETQVARSAAAFAKTKPYEEIKIDPSDPRSVVQQLYADMSSGKLTLSEFKSLTYGLTEGSVDKEDEKSFQRMMSKFRTQVSAAGLPLDTLADLMLSNTHYSVEGDDALGYKVTAESAGTPAQDMFVVKDKGHYKLVGYSMTDSVDAEKLATLALQEVDKNNLTAARTWLDRAREKIHIGAGDDPLSGNPFAYFWTKGQQADAATIRTAALVLLPSDEVTGAYLSELEHARQTAKNDLDHSRLTMTLAYAYSAQERWADVLPLADELMKSFPSSLRAFSLKSLVYLRLKQFDESEKLNEARIREYPDELGYVRAAARLASYRGQFTKAREILKTLIDKGKASEGDLNEYAWFALDLPDPIDQDTLDIAQRASDLSKNVNFAILHTQACIEAAAGKPNQASELLLKAMEAGQLDEPDSEVWFGFAMVAEQYGVNDAAATMYGRVEKPKFESPGSTYALAQQRLAQLHVGHEPVKAAAK